MNDEVFSGPRASLAPPRSLLSETEKTVQHASDTYALKLFQAVADRVPAYKDFLKKHDIDPARIRMMEDFKQVPTINKKNYLSQYTIEERCWDGTLKGKEVIYTSSSGSTGVPYYFPRDAALDYRSSLLFELYLSSVSRGNVPQTLFIVSYGMGVWIGGLITYQSMRLLAERGYPVSVITPGSNKKEIFEALKRLAPLYEQVVLGGYPPFMKDVLDEAPEHGFDPAKRPLKLLGAAESFGETFREYVMRHAGTSDPSFDTGSLYGTADIGTMAIETPAAIAMRRLAMKTETLYAKLFPDATKLPTLAQFHPAITYFEELDGMLAVSGDNVMPLVRYELGDRGGVHSYASAMEAAETVSPGFAAALREAGAPMPPLPFVYVYERADFSCKLYGAIIYAEHVRAGLMAPDLEQAVTGKFSMSTERDEGEDEYLDIHVERKPKASEDESLRLRVRDAIVASLRERNAEYRYLSDNLKDRVLPRITLWPHEHPQHFRPGAKQQWINKHKKS